MMQKNTYRTQWFCRLSLVRWFNHSIYFRFGFRYILSYCYQWQWLPKSGFGWVGSYCGSGSVYQLGPGYNFCCGQHYAW